MYYKLYYTINNILSKLLVSMIKYTVKSMSLHACVFKKKDQWSNCPRAVVEYGNDNRMSVYSAAEWPIGGAMTLL